MIKIQKNIKVVVVQNKETEKEIFVCWKVQYQDRRAFVCTSTQVKLPGIIIQTTSKGHIITPCGAGCYGNTWIMAFARIGEGCKKINKWIKTAMYQINNRSNTASIKQLFHVQPNMLMVVKFCLTVGRMETISTKFQARCKRSEPWTIVWNAVNPCVRQCHVHT